MGLEASGLYALNDQTLLLLIGCKLNFSTFGVLIR